MSKGLLLCATFLIFASYLFPAKAKVLRFNHLTVNDGLAQNGVMGIAEDRYGFMWFGTWNGLCRFDGYDFTIYHPDESDSTALINNRILQVYADTIGDVWVLFSDSYLVCRYNFESDNFARFHPDDVHPNIIDSLHRYRPFKQSVAQTPKYRWQIKAEEMALVQFNRSDSSTHRYLPDPLNPWSLNYDLLTELYLDSREVLWVGTISRGLNMADTRQKPILNIGRKHGIDFPSEIRAITTDKNGRLWVGTREDGFYAIDRKTNTIKHYKFEDGRAGDENSDQIRKIYEDKLGLIWIGTKGGLRCYNPETQQFRHYQLHSSSWIPNNWVFEIMEDYKGDLWIGTFWGISRYIREEDRFQPLSNDMPLSSVKVRDILEDKYRNLWVATEAGGLTLLKRGVNHAGEEQFVPVFYMHDPLNEETISSNYTYCMDQDENGFIWIGTPNGLNRLNPSTGTFRRYGEADGLPDRKIVGLVCDSAGSVWVSHKKGLSRIDIATNKVSSYNYFDGLQGNEFSQNASYRDSKSGELFFGGVHGLNSFFASDLEKNPYVPLVYLSGLEIMNQKIGVGQSWNKRVILKKPLYLTDSITLGYDDRTLTIDFVGLHFSNPPAIQYRYMLEGFDRDWIYVDAKKRSAAYSNLPAGTYQFKAMAANPDGLWSPEPATLTLQILPPWWKTQWAYGLYFMLLGLVFYWIYRILEIRIKYRQQVTYERLKASKLEEFNALREKFFTQMAHEIRTPLTLILGPLEKIMQEKLYLREGEKSLQMIKRSANRLQHIINELLDFKKIEAGKAELNLTKNNLSEHLSKVFEAFRMQATHRKIDYVFEGMEQTLSAQYDYDKMETVIYNLLSNAFKYTHNGGRITLSVMQKNDLEPKSEIQIHVCDTGIGIAKDQQEKIFEMFYHQKGAQPAEGKSSGIGLALTHELVSMHGGKVTVDSEEGKGSCFIVHLPQAHKNVDGPAIQETESATLDGSSSGLDSPSELPLILVIDDHADVRTYLSEALSASYLVKVAADGHEGHIKAIELLPDLIISDVMMPGMDGMELCQRLKSDISTSHIPIILLTARQQNSDAVEGYDRGADAYMVKPFSLEVIQSQIRSLLSNRTRLKEIFTKDSGLNLLNITNNVTDQAFIDKVVKTLDTHLDQTDFTSETLAEELQMSRTLLYKKIKALTGVTVHAFMLKVRMQKAAELLLSGNFNVSQVAYMVGFSVPGNFSRSFQKFYGISPSKYLHEHRNDQTANT